MKRLVASIVQNGTEPVAIVRVHENTLGGNVSITRIGPGESQLFCDALLLGRFVATLGIGRDDNNGWTNQCHPSDNMVNIMTYSNGTLADDCMASGQWIMIERFD